VSLSGALLAATASTPAPCPFNSTETPWPARTGDHAGRLRLRLDIKAATLAACLPASMPMARHLVTSGDHLKPILSSEMNNVRA
jgi:hypothetical protein